MENKVFNEIRSNLFRSYIFYVPKQFYHYIDPHFISEIIKPNNCNIVYYSNLQQEIYDKPSSFDGLELSLKMDLLDSNISKLIKLKNELMPSEFKLIYLKYGEYVGIHCLFTLWMSKNVAQDLPRTSLAIQNMFLFQERIFDKHADKLELQFSDVTLIEDVDEYQIMEVVSETVEEIPQPILNNVEENKSSIKANEKPLKEKKALMTDEKARKYILETVFGIEPKYL